MAKRMFPRFNDEDFMDGLMYKVSIDKTSEDLEATRRHYLKHAKENTEIEYHYLFSVRPQIEAEQRRHYLVSEFLPKIESVVDRRKAELIKEKINKD